MKASELRATIAALDAISTDLGDLEARGRAHEKADAERFAHLSEGAAQLEHEIEFVKNHLNLVHDQLLEGFRKLGALIDKRDPNEVTPPRRGRNGR